MDKEIYLIKSIDRQNLSSTTSNTFDIKFQNYLEGKFELVYAIIPNNLYNVYNYTINSVTYGNNKLYFNENSTNKTATLTAGFYTTIGASSIATEVQSALNTASGGYATFTVTLSSITGLLTISSTQNFSLKFASNSLYSSSYLLGFPNTDTSAGTSAVSTYVPRLNVPSSLSINIRQTSISGFQTGTGQYGSIIIPLDVSFGDIKYYTVKNDFCQYIRLDRPLSVMTIEIRDTAGNILNMNGNDFEVAIKKC